MLVIFTKHQEVEGRIFGAHQLVTFVIDDVVDKLLIKGLIDLLKAFILHLSDLPDLLLIPGLMPLQVRDHSDKDQGSLLFTKGALHLNAVHSHHLRVAAD